jgi:hypothetical protein
VASKEEEEERGKKQKKQKIMLWKLIISQHLAPLL